jgi:hypothetical protein
MLIAHRDGFGAIAVIRTFLNYFLETDLERAKIDGPSAVHAARPPEAAAGALRGDAGRLTLVWTPSENSHRHDIRNESAGCDEAGSRSDAPGSRTHVDGVGSNSDIAHLVRLHVLQVLRVFCARARSLRRAGKESNHGDSR